MDRKAIIAVERGPLRVGYPEGQEAVLLIDVDGLSAGLDAQVEAILKICREAGCTEVRTAQSPEGAPALVDQPQGRVRRGGQPGAQLRRPGRRDPAVQAHRGAGRGRRRRTRSTT